MRTLLTTNQIVGFEFFSSLWRDRGRSEWGMFFMILRKSTDLQHDWLLIKPQTTIFQVTCTELCMLFLLSTDKSDRILLLASCCWFIEQRKPQHSNTTPQHSQPGFPPLQDTGPPRHLIFIVILPPFFAPWISPCSNFSFCSPPSFLPAPCQPQITLQEKRLFGYFSLLFLLCLPSAHPALLLTYL